MIETSPFTDNLMKIRGEESAYDRIAKDISDVDFSDERGYGFVIEQAEADYISSKLVIKSATTIEDYNDETGEIDKIEQPRRLVIPFRIDFERGFVEVFSNKQDTKKVITRLGSTGADVTIDPLDLNLPSMVSELTQITDFDVKSMKIDEFSINEYTTGNYHLNILDQKEADRLLDEYESNTSYVGLEFPDENGTVTVGIFDSGSVRIFSDTDNEDQILTNLKDAINFSGGEN